MAPASPGSTSPTAPSTSPASCPATAASPPTSSADDILRWLPVAATRGERFERVFASYGTLVWLSDLADGIAQVLVPGGRFVLVEFHPFALYFDPHWQPAYDYFSREPIAESGVSDYVAESGASLAPSGYRAGVERTSATLIPATSSRAWPM